MTNREIEQKKCNLEMFNNVVALYTILKSNTQALRPVKVLYRADEAETLPIDFVIDVEVKTKRLLGEPLYLLFLRAVFNESLEILPELTREALGAYWLSYGLGPDGAYRKLFYNVKNEQFRSYLKEKNGNANNAVGTYADRDASSGDTIYSA